jgi:hypothetical protein
MLTLNRSAVGSDPIENPCNQARFVIDLPLAAKIQIFTVQIEGVVIVSVIAFSVFSGIT